MASEEYEKYYTLENFQKGLDSCFDESVKLFYENEIKDGIELTEIDIIIAKRFGVKIPE